MKRIIKFTLGIVVTVLILVGIAFAAVTIFVNPNNIKPYLTKVVAEKTGHDLEIVGKLKWSIYPQLGISAENVIVKNKPNFPDEPLLNAKKLIVSVQLVPLFSKQLKVDEIIVNDVNLNLTLNQANQTNWDFKKSSHSSNQSNSSNDSNNSSSFSIDVSKIAIKNANIKYKNMIENRTTKVSGFNLTTKDIHPNEPFKIDSDFNIKDTHYSFTGKIQYHAEEALLLLQEYNFNFEGTKKATLSGNAEINIKTERLEMNPLHFQMADLEANGSLSGNKIFSNLDIKGQIETNNFNPKTLFSASGHPIRTIDSDALSSAKFTSEISIESKTIRFKNIQASIDKTKLNGNASYFPGKSLLSFNLNGDQIAIDRYTLAKNGTHKNGSKKEKSENRSRNNSFSANGKIAFNTIYAKKARFDNFKSDLNYSNNQLRFTNLSANVFEGSTSGSVTIDTKPKAPIVHVNQNLKQISVAAAQNIILGEAKVTGKANARINISLQNGLNSLNGDINVISRNGEIKGIDVDYQLQRAAFFIQKITEKGLEDRGKTPYSVFTAQINIKKGIANNPSMVIESPTMKVRARGKTNLITKELNYKLAARSKKGIEIDTELVRMDLANYDIPIIVKGTIDNPKVSIDLTELAKIAAKTQLLKTIEKHILPAAGKPLGETIDKIKDILPF